MSVVRALDSMGPKKFTLKQTNKDDYLPCEPFKLVIPSHKEVSDRISENVTAFACTASFIALVWGSKSPPVLESPNLVRQFSWASEWSYDEVSK